MKTLIAVIASDLSPDGLSIGPEAVKACDKAINYPIEFSIKAFVACLPNDLSLGNIHYALMVCNQPNSHKNVCDLMRDYLVSNGIDSDKIFIEVANKFNTNGELGALAKLVVDKKIERVVIVARWWHIPRIKFLWLFHQIHFTRHVEEVFVSVSSKYWFKIFIDPTLGITHNVLRWLFKGY